MPINAISYFSSSAREHRTIVVINGQPYYKASGLTYFEPFLMLRGKGMINTSKIPAGFDKKGLVTLFSDSMFRHDGLVQCDRQFFQESMIDVTLNQNDFVKRFAKKEHLMVSYRLSLPTKEGFNILYGKGGCPLEEKTLQESGIPKRKIAWATSNPISVIAEPLKYTHDPDQINHWLVQQGATFAKQVLTFPSSYYRIWYAKPSLIVPSKNKNSEETAKLENAKKMLSDYTKNGSWIKRALTCHLGRNYVEEVENIRKREFKTWSEMKTALFQEIQAKKNKNLKEVKGTDENDFGNGSLAQRISFINQM